MVGLAFAYLDFSEANIIMIYQLGVLVVAMVTSGRLYSLAASILSILIFNFFFTVPLFTFHFNDKSYLATFLVMFLVAFLSSSLTTRIKRQARLASRQAYRTQVLLEASQTLQKAEGQEAILEAMAVQLRKLLERTALYYPVLPDGHPGPAPGSSPWSPPWTQEHTWALTRRRWPPGCRRTTSTPAPPPTPCPTPSASIWRCGGRAAPWRWRVLPSRRAGSLTPLRKT